MIWDHLTPPTHIWVNCPKFSRYFLGGMWGGGFPNTSTANMFHQNLHVRGEVWSCNLRSGFYSSRLNQLLKGGSRERDHPAISSLHKINGGYWAIRHRSGIIVNYQLGQQLYATMSNSLSQNTDFSKNRLILLTRHVLW